MLAEANRVELLCLVVQQQQLWAIPESKSELPAGSPEWAGFHTSATPSRRCFSMQGQRKGGLTVARPQRGELHAQRLHASDDEDDGAPISVVGGAGALTCEYLEDLAAKG